MNILILRPRLEQGGVRSFIELLGEGMAVRGHHAAVVTSEDPLLGRLEERGIGVHFCPLHPSSAGNLVRAVGPLSSLVRSEQIDLLFSTHRFTTVAGKFVSRMTGAPLLVTLRERSRSLDRLAGIWMGRPTIVPSQALKDDLVVRLGRNPDHIAVIPNGVPLNSSAAADALGPAEAGALRASLGLKPHLPVIGYAGRLSPEKGVSDLLASAGILRDRGVPFQTLIVGDGVEGPLLRERCRQLGLEDRVTFAGSRTDAPELMTIMDVLAVPSLQESFGWVVLEGMRASRPVVASCVGGLPEVVQDGVTGLLAPPSTPPAFADALARLLADPALSKKMGEAGRKTVEAEFSADVMVDRYLSLFQQALSI